jgi:hypothetical protein
MATDLSSVTVWLRPELKERLRESAFHARRSISAHAASIIEAAMPEPELAPEPAPPRRMTPGAMQELARLGYQVDDLSRLSATDIERIVQQQIARPKERA